MLSSLPRLIIGNSPNGRPSAVACNCMLRTLKLLEHNNINTNGQKCHMAGEVLAPSQILGIDHLRDPRLHKGLAFTLEERQALGIHGLMPPCFKTMEEQLVICKISVERYQEDLNKYLYLTELGDRNEKLFFRLLSENVERLMPIVYTPTVGLACQRFGMIFRRPRGLFITSNDQGNVFSLIKNWPEPGVRAVCVTDGERILGLGDLGCSGMGIPIGKLSLYTALAGIKPSQCLPIMLDVGTNNEKLLEDPTYIGLRQKRVTGTDYDDLVDELMCAIVKRYGQNTLIQYEDFANHNAFRLLDKYRNQYCTFNDDIQGTASVVVAGLLACKRPTGRPVADNIFMFLGAGGAALGIAELLVRAMTMEGVEEQAARDKIWMLDVHGLLAEGRPDPILGNGTFYAKKHAPSKDLKALVTEIKPTVLIGASAQSGAFTAEILNQMGQNSTRPIIFALSNPTSKAECTAQQAYDNTEGRCIFASGSPFPPVKYKGKEYRTGQGNNAYIFPGVALGIISTGMYHIQDEIFVIAAQTVADNVSDEQIQLGGVYPALKDIQEVSKQIATKIAEHAYEKDLASVYPEPDDKRAFVESMSYNFHYEQALPTTYGWPEPPKIKVKAIEPAELIAPHH